MNKSLAYLSIGIFGTIGGYIPVLLGSDGISGWSLLGGTIGSFFGLYVTYKFG